MKKAFVFLSVFLIVSLVLPFYQIPEVKANPDETFGKEKIGDNTYNGGENRLYLDQATLTEDGTVIKISLYGKLASSGSVHMMTAIYDDNSGEPNDLMGYSNEISVTTTLQWWNFTCDIELNAGNYWLGWNQEAAPAFTYYYDSGNARYKNGVEYDDGFPSSAPSMSSTPKDFSIFATYTTAGVQEYSEEFTETIGVSASLYSWRALFRSQTETVTVTTTSYLWGEYPCFFTETATITMQTQEWIELQRFFTETLTPTDLSYFTKELVALFEETFSESISISALLNIWKAKLIEIQQTTTVTEVSSFAKEILKIFIETTAPTDQMVKYIALIRLFQETLSPTTISYFTKELLVAIAEFIQSETININALLSSWKAKQTFFSETTIPSTQFYKWISLRQFFTETINPTETLQLLREKLLSVTETINTSAFLHALKETLVTIIEFTDTIPFGAEMYLIFPAGVVEYATKGFVLATIMLLLLVGLPIIALIIWRRKQ